MDKNEWEAMARRVEALEARVALLEGKEREGRSWKDMAARMNWPPCMTKTNAAKAIGVSRQTIYAMIADGRLKQNEHGRVITDGLINMIRPAAPSEKRQGRKKREAQAGGAL